MPLIGPPICLADVQVFGIAVYYKNIHNTVSGE